MKICFVADGRSPIARNWITHFIRPQHEVHVISSYPCTAESLSGAIVEEVPVAFSGLLAVSQEEGNGSSGLNVTRSSVMDVLRSKAYSKLSLAAQRWLIPVDLQRQVQRVNRLINRISPDIVHAMRIPFEGILTAKALTPRVPLLISVWGNDFTLWASRNSVIARQTNRALQRADALHCDCRRDLELASRNGGFDSNKPVAILPGAGGVQTSLFYSGQALSSLRNELNIPDGAPIIFNPRGLRAYVRNDVFFKAIPQVLRQSPNAVFVCAGMQGDPIARRWLSQFAIHDRVRLLPSVPRERMGDLFRLASVSISPSVHDGTPNTLLEAMACGCFPVAGDIESIREWIDDGRNGLLCDPTNSESVARAIIRALSDPQLRNGAREHNLRLVAERAVYRNVMQQAEAFYYRVVEQKRQGSQA